MIPEGPHIALAGACGLVLGSFAVTTGVRAARGESALTGRSRCDACQAALSFARTVPVVSFIGQGGACASCGARIDPTHLAGEIAGAVVVTAALLADTPLRAGLAVLCGLVLIGASAVDWKIQRLPDRATAAVAVVCAVLAATRSTEELLLGAVSAALVGMALMVLRRWSSRGGRSLGLGLGDVKLAAALAIWLGPLSAWMLAGASVLGLAVMAMWRPADGRLPFGPMLAGAGWTVGMILETGRWPTTF